MRWNELMLTKWLPCRRCWLTIVSTKAKPSLPFCTTRQFVFARLRLTHPRNLIASSSLRFSKGIFREDENNNVIWGLACSFYKHTQRHSAGKWWRYSRATTWQQLGDRNRWNWFAIPVGVLWRRAWRDRWTNLSSDKWSVWTSRSVWLVAPHSGHVCSNHLRAHN